MLVRIIVFPITLHFLAGQKPCPSAMLWALKAKKGLHIMVDSTGIKVYGEGEWKVKKHGIAKHRTWLKLHLCVDAQSQEIVGMSLTDNSIDDAHAAQEMLNAAPLPMLSIRGDGAYDKFFFREKLGNEVQQIIPPPRNAVLKNGMEKIPIPNYLVQRNKAVERIKEVGRKAWKEEINYHRRSLVETTMFRYKVIFGDKSTARIKENQETEAKIKCKILNVFTNMGMPKTTKIFKN
jgi:Transposase DDE domain.